MRWCCGMGVGLLFLSAVLVALIGAGLWSLSRRRQGEAQDLLARRLAVGEISPEEYLEKMALLGASSKRVTVLQAVGVGLVVLGVAAGLVLVTLGLVGMISMPARMREGTGPMNEMMGRGMGSMMRGETAPMMDGRTGRSAPAPQRDAREVSVVATEFAFRPAEVTVRAAEIVNLVLENRGHMYHTLTVGELGFELRARGARTIGGAFRAETPGNYVFICAVPGHAEAGMQGVIRVEV